MSSGQRLTDMDIKNMTEIGMPDIKLSINNDKPIIIYVMTNNQEMD